MNVLLDEIKKRHRLITDRQLAKLLCISSPTISNLRSGEQPSLSPTIILRIYDKAKMSIEEIRELARES